MTDTNEIVYFNLYDENKKLTKNQVRNMIISKLKFIENLVQDNERFQEIRNEIKKKLYNNFQNFSIKLKEEVEENIVVEDAKDEIQEIEEIQEEIVAVEADLDEEEEIEVAYDTKTYIMDSDSDGEESFIPNKKYLENLNISALKNIMTTNHLKKSKNGIILKKKDMIKTIQKHLKKK